MPTVFNLKRPPPSPIVAPVDHNEEPLAAGEPPAKVPKLEHIDNNVHAEEEAAAVAVAVASYKASLELEEDVVQEEILPAAEVEVPLPLPLEQAPEQYDLHETTATTSGAGDEDELNAPLALDMPPDLPPAIPLPLPIDAPDDLPPLSPIENHRPLPEEADVTVADDALGEQSDGAAGAEELTEAAELLSPVETESPTEPEGGLHVVVEAQAFGSEAMPSPLKDEVPREFQREGAVIQAQALDVGEAEQNAKAAAEEVLDEETANVIDMAVERIHTFAAVHNATEEASAVEAVEELPTEEGMVHDESAVDMAIDAMESAEKSRGMEEAPVNVGEEAVATTPAEGEEVAVESIVDDHDALPTTTTVVKKTMVVIGTDTGEVIKTETIYEEQPLPGLPQRRKKERREFTAEEKLKILSELDGPNGLSVNGVLQKYGVSKSSLHRWRQPEKVERLQEMVAGGNKHGGDGILGSKDKLRKRDMNDKLRKIKFELQGFCKENLAKGPEDQMAITSSLIQLRANEIKDELLARLGQVPDLLTEEEVIALQAFKGSKSWACLVGNQLGYLSTAGSVRWSDKAKANTAAYLEANSRTPPKPKKQRMEFTAQEKLGILQELEHANSPENRPDGAPLVTVDQICKKYQTSKSSLHRWKQQYRSGRLQELAATGSGFCNSKRVFNDKLHVIKKALNDFYVDNENAQMEKKIPINYTTLQARAIMSKELLLMNHYNAMHKRMMTEQQQADEEKVKGESESEAQAAAQVELQAVQGDAPESREEAQVAQVELEAAQVELQTAQGEAPQEAQAAQGETQETVVDSQTSKPVAQEAEGTQKIEVDFQVAGSLQKREGEAHAVSETCQIQEGNKKLQEKEETGSSDSDILNRDLVHALENFKASNSWLRETAKKFGWKLDMDGKKDSTILMESMMTNANTVVANAPMASAVYHHPAHHQGMEPPVAEHHVVEYQAVPSLAEAPGHHGVQHPVPPQLPVAPDLHAVEHPVAVEHQVVQQQQAVAQDPVPAEQQAVIEGQTVEHHHVQHSVAEGHHVNEHHQQHQEVDHLAPIMTVYDDQGNLMPY